MAPVAGHCGWLQQRRPTRKNSRDVDGTKKYLSTTLLQVHSAQWPAGDWIGFSLEMAVSCLTQSATANCEVNRKEHEQVRKSIFTSAVMDGQGK